jgi:hypothetical protein
MGKKEKEREKRTELLSEKYHKGYCRCCQISPLRLNPELIFQRSNPYKIPLGKKSNIYKISMEKKEKEREKRTELLSEKYQKALI